MNTRMARLPRLELLETKTVMSSGASTAPAAIVRLEPGPVEPSLPSHHDLAEPASTKARKVELSGQANGFYTSRERLPDAGTRFQVNANGTIAPFGAAFVTGSFHTLGSTDGGVATGSLTIEGKQGKLHLSLTESSLAADATSTGQAAPNYPGGPMITGSTGASEPTAGEPIILINTFRFEIKSGTGQYADDRGTGSVQIETTPVLSTPTGPGIYSSSLASTAATGQAIVTFSPSPDHSN